MEPADEVPPGGPMPSSRGDSEEPDGPPPSGGGSVKRWLTRVGRLVLTVAVTLFIADRIGLGMEDVAALGPEWWRPRPLELLASALLLLCVNFFSGIVWARMVRDIGGPRLAPGTAIRIFLIANLGRYVPGKVWQIAGLVALAGRHGVPAAIATGAAVLGHVLSLAAATLVGGATFIGTPASGGIDGRWLTGGVAVLLALVILPPVSRRGIALYARVTRSELDASTVHPGTALLWVAMFVVAWIGYAASFYLFARSFDVAGPAVTIGPAFAAAYVVGYLAIFAPAGIGVREVALVGLLTPSTGAPTAVGLAVVARLWITLVEVVPGAALAAREASLGAARTT